MATKMTREAAIKIVQSATVWTDEEKDALAMLIPELAESEDERIRKELISMIEECTNWIHKKEYIAFLEKLKENPKSADSIPSDCASDVKCEDRWHKVTDSLPDNGRLVLAKDCLGNVLLARYDGENWEVDVYDNEDHYCHNSISKWCEIPSEKQKEQKPIVTHGETYHVDTLGTQQVISGKMPQKPAKWSEEDEEMLNSCISSIEEAKENRYAYKETDGDTSYDHEIDWLKSLRPSWKPSEEQMKALNVLNCHGALSYVGQQNQLISLYNDLKKLM